MSAGLCVHLPGVACVYLNEETIDVIVFLFSSVYLSYNADC